MHSKKRVLSGIKLTKLLFLMSIFLMSGLYAITLEQAVFQTLNTNPDVKEKIYNLELVKKERDIALSGYYPKLYVSVGTGLAKEKIVPAYNEQSGDMVTRTDSSIVASMNLFNGFHTFHDLESQRHRANAAQSYLDEYKTLITMQTVESYINMMKLKSILQISIENVVWHQEIIEKLKEYTELGKGKASDLEFASGRMTLSEINRVVHENNFIQAKVVFESLYGASVEVEKLKEPMFDYILPNTLKSAALMALDYNPSIQLGQYNISSAYNNYKRSQSVYYPSIDIEMKKSMFDERGTYEYSVDTSYVMVYFNYNLFNGFSDRAVVENELTTYFQNNQNLQYTKRDVTKQLGIAWISSIKIQEQLDLLEKMRAYSKNTLDDYYKEFSIGKRTLLDIISVKSDYNSARQSYEVAKYDLLLSKFRILNAMGVLLEYFTSKADSMELIINEGFVESKSVYEIIKDMNEKLQNKEDYVSYDESNYTSFDSVMEEQDRDNEVDPESLKE